MLLRNRKFDYKWVILCVCFMMEFICLGFASSNAGMYLTATTDALGFERSLYSLNTSFRQVVSIVVSLFFGSLLNKFGTKKLVCIGLISIVLSTGLNAYASQLYQFYIAGALLGVGAILTGSTMASTVIRMWFDKNIGKYTGIALCANGIGGAVAAQIIAPYIYSIDPFGYRIAYKISALIILVSSIVIMVLLKEPPTRPIPTEKAKKGPTWSGLSFEEVKRKPYFYYLIILVFLNGICIESIGNSGVAHFKDSGIDGDFIANISTVASLVLTVGKVLIGIFYDKKGLRVTLMTCHIIVVISLIMVQFADNSILGRTAAMGCMALGRLALPIETVMLPLIAADLFGSNAMVGVIGVLVAAVKAGSCIDAPLCNFVYDITGSYIPIYVCFSIMMVLVAIGFQVVINTAYKDKQRILNPAEKKLGIG